MFKNKIDTKEIEKINEVKEIKTMLTLLAEKIKIEGKIEEMKEVLIKQISKKFGLSENEIEIIKGAVDINKLDEAIESFVFAEKKDVIFNCLK